MTQYTKKEILLQNGYELMTGYCFDACPAENEFQTFVEKEEVESVIKHGAKEYYIDEGGEMIFDEHDAWERLYDNYIDLMETPEGGVDLSIDEFTEKMLSGVLHL